MKNKMGDRLEDIASEEKFIKECKSKKYLEESFLEQHGARRTRLSGKRYYIIDLQFHHDKIGGTLYFVETNQGYKLEK